MDLSQPRIPMGYGGGGGGRGGGVTVGIEVFSKRCGVLRARADFADVIVIRVAAAAAAVVATTKRTS